eukprot:gb/GECG01006147.1/.p1 GENE.gb/GECG01006147.1/~~gb/GECG01006147.1/.p1  ORF type:complete len:244 (+),score=55.55 gb/GECG01006147.1/:1-732(+)
MSAQGKRKSEGKGRSSKGGKRTGAAASVERETVVALYEQLLKEAAEERKEDGEEGEYRRDDDLDVYGIFKLAEKLETSPQEDIDILIFSWAGGAEKGSTISKEEFKKAMEYFDVEDVKSLKTALANTKNEILNDERQFRSFFKKAHKLNCEPGLKWIPKEVAVPLLKLIFQWHEHAHLDQFCEFLEASAGSEYSRIKPDEWEQFLALDKVKHDCSDYSEESAMPIIYDDYASWVQQGKPGASS